MGRITFIEFPGDSFHSMAKKDFTILNKLGIHARPAAQFVKTANRFQSDIYVEKDGEEVDGKSIMGLMMLAAGHGSVISVNAEGADADAALAALGDLIDRKFEED
jgi:phosphotransferase system HPr (HPr) family protein